MMSTPTPAIPGVKPVHRVETQRVQTRRADGAFSAAPLDPAAVLQRDLQVARHVAKLMDAKFRVGPMKLGLDSLIGLVPVAGDVAGFAIGMYPVYLARKHKLGKLTIARMLGNLGTDFLIGAIPIAGDVADAFFKSNLKNYKLLEDAVEKRRLRG